ncbi:MAG: hypothetical protein ACP5HM_16320 [Anaerolineae bacterium]
MTSIPNRAAIDNLRVDEVRATIAECAAPLSHLLADARLRRNVPLALQGILSRTSPVITKMAQGMPRSVGSAWAVAKRFYHLLRTRRISTAQFTKGLYLRARATVRAEAPRLCRGGPGSGELRETLHPQTGRGEHGAQEHAA